MAFNSYTNGTQVRLSCTFTIAGVATDPSSVTFRVLDPVGNTTVYTGAQVARDGVGQYHVDVFLGSSGIWYYRVEGVGAVTVAAENQLNVKVSRF